MASNRVGPEPKPGDLIEIFRYNYQHWAVYVGNGYVVHLTGVDAGVSGANLVSSVSGVCTQAVVKKEPLTKVAAGNLYRVNNKHDRKHKPLPPEKIVQRAERLVGKVWPYNLTRENCEHFATRLRYGIGHSDQVEKKAPQIVGGFLGAVGVGVLAVLAFVGIQSTRH